MAKNTNNKPPEHQESVNDMVKSICDIMRRGNVTSAVRELPWIPFPRVPCPFRLVVHGELL